MKLGILVNTQGHAGELSAITRAALGKGHEVSIFVMDKGVLLLGQPELAALASLEGVSIKYCDYNAMTNHVSGDSIVSGAEAGSQLDNAIMMRDADRVIAL